MSSDEEYNVAILSRSVSEDESEQFRVTSLVRKCHENAITQILALSDNIRRLSFVTMSIDGYMKILADDGTVENSIEGKGMILNGCVIPNRQDFFAVSSFNDESEKNHVTIYRRQMEKKDLDSFA